MHSEPVRPPAPVTATFMPDAFVVTGRRSGRVVVSAPANRRDAIDAPPRTEVREESAVVDAMAEAMSTSEELSTGVTPKFADVSAKSLTPTERNPKCHKCRQNDS